ncbi:MAG: hypothetical protein ABIJ59_19385 [Pseudomonadota bacterium]
MGLWQLTIGGGYGIAGYFTVGKNDGHWNFGGGLGFGLGFGGSYNPDNNDPNTPIASGNNNNGDASSLGLKAQGAVGLPGLSKYAQATLGLSSMLKGDSENSAWSTIFSGGASFLGLSGGGAITSEINRNNCDGEWSGHLSPKLDGSIGFLGYGFAGIGGGYTWK